MSTWTHIAGVIRFDGLMDDVPHCGNTVVYDGTEAEWDACDVPCGSEGSVVINSWTNPDNSCLARHTVAIFGDLRSYSDEFAIIEYFDRIVKDRSIRDAVYTFHVEGADNRTFVYSHEDRIFQEVL